MCLRFDPRSGHVGFAVDKMAVGQVFSQFLAFLARLIPPAVPHSLSSLSSTLVGRAIAQAVSRWLPTAAARVRALVWSCGICG
jgi:hypothetical protein